MDKNIRVLTISVNELVCLLKMLDDVIVFSIMGLDHFVEMNDFFRILETCLNTGSEDSSYLEFP